MLSEYIDRLKRKVHVNHDVHAKLMSLTYVFFVASARQQPMRNPPIEINANRETREKTSQHNI